MIQERLHSNKGYPNRNGAELLSKRKIARRDVILAPLRIAAGLVGVAAVGRIIQAVTETSALPHPNLGEGDKELIQKTLGINPEEYGYSGKVNIQNRSNKYLLHLGQNHVDQYSKRIYDPEYLDDIATSQAQLESLLLASNIRNLFVEGVNPTFLSKLDEKLALQKWLASLPVDSNIWDAFEKAYANSMRTLQILSPEQQFTHYIFVRQSSRIQQNIQAAQAALQKAGDSSNNVDLQTYGFAPSVDRQGLNLLTESAPPILAADYRNAYAFLGPLKMYADGNATVFPSSTEEEDTELNKWQINHAMVKQAIDSASTILEEEKLQDKLRYLQSQFETQFIHSRETAAVERILTHEAAEDLGIVPYVLGYGHDLTDQVLNHNQRNPKGEFGLITLTPQIM